LRETLMRIYFDTEFTQFRDGQLLSAGFVADDDRFLYVEIDEPVRRVAASDFCRQHVLPQFGVYPLAAVRTEAEAGRRIAEWLLGFGRRVVLSYDYKLDWVFLEATIQAAALWSSVATVVEAHNVAYEASQESALAAQESYLDRASWPGRHHALVDAHGLRERWREYERILRESGNA